MNGYVALVAAVCLALLSLPAQGLSCGSVYDGLGNRQFDLNTQSSTSTIAAHWFGFDDDVLNYEWAVASSSLAPSVPAPGTCGQFFKLPDVVDWTNAHRDTSASISTLKLSVGTTYFVLLRITSANGKQVVAASDGVTVVAPKLDAFASEALSSSGAATTPFRSARSAAAVDAIPFSTCPIDAANRCRQTQKPVGQVLREIYGEPVYNPESPIALLFLVGRLSDRARAGIFPDTPLTRTFQRDFEGVGLVGKTADFGDALIPISESSDDDDGLAPGDAPAWVIAPIIGGIFLCGLLLFCLVLVTRVLGRNREGGSGGSSGGSGGSFAAGAADSAEKKQYAGRNVIGVTNTSDRTDISFPDTAIKRLSITHNDTAVDDLEEATRSPRRKHPIMQSTSSSFRDYRNNG